MQAGIGLIEVVILLIVGGAILFGLSAVVAALRRRGSVSGGANALHPSLSQCPACGAPLSENVSSCTQCGLRVS